MVFFLQALFVFLVDQLTKFGVRRIMEPGESIPVLDGVLQLTYVRNPGAAFGFLAYRTTFFVLVTVAVLTLIVVFYWRTRTSRNRSFLRVALSLELGGAAGNLLDRLSTGYVTDFLDLRVWPVFNLADVAIVAGVFLLAFTLLRDPWGPSPLGQVVGPGNGECDARRK